MNARPTAPLVSVQRQKIPGSPLVAVSPVQLDELEQQAMDMASLGADQDPQAPTALQGRVYALRDALLANRPDAVLAAVTHLEELARVPRGHRMLDRVGSRS